MGKHYCGVGMTMKPFVVIMGEGGLVINGKLIFLLYGEREI